MFAWYRGRVFAVILSMAFWAIANLGWIALGSDGRFDASNHVLWPSQPFSGVITLTMWMRGITISDFRLLAWAFAASSIFAALAGVVFLVAQLSGEHSRAFLLPQPSSNN
jgi:hypothetical protein